MRFVVAGACDQSGGEQAARLSEKRGIGAWGFEQLVEARFGLARLPGIEQFADGFKLAR